LVELNDFAAVRTKNATVFHGNNLEVLPFMADNSVDSIVCDPPYELGFMGKSWDSTGIAYSVDLWRECLRVLKPGGHILAFGGSRTWHRVAVAIEDAGFELRDSIAWLYGSGFPKSLDVSKAIDKAAGADREVLGVLPSSRAKASDSGFMMAEKLATAPATPEAEKWQGWGTALKPAFEPVVVGRKPLIGTVAANVLEWGVGGLNIDASRIETNDDLSGRSYGGTFGASRNEDGSLPKAIGSGDKGRWPANIILDEYTAELLDEQQEEVSRFFYVSKASKRDRNEGLDELDGQEIGSKGNGLARTCATCGASVLDGCECPDRTFINPTRKNFHPTVKPTDLMRYLIKLVTPAGGTVLDPFTGSGSTGKAALLDGYQFLGVEMTADYLPIIQGRLEWAENEYLNAADKENEVLF